MSATMALELVLMLAVLAPASASAYTATRTLADAHLGAGATIRDIAATGRQHDERARWSKAGVDWYACNSANRIRLPGAVWRG
jgi:hypothetical protein